MNVRVDCDTVLSRNQYGTKAIARLISQTKNKNWDYARTLRCSAGWSILSIEEKGTFSRERKVVKPSSVSTRYEFERLYSFGRATFGIISACGVYLNCFCADSARKQIVMRAGNRDSKGILCCKKKGLQKRRKDIIEMMKLSSGFMSSVFID